MGVHALIGASPGKTKCFRRVRSPKYTNDLTRASRSSKTQFSRKRVLLSDSFSPGNQPRGIIDYYLATGDVLRLENQQLRIPRICPASCFSSAQKWDKLLTIWMLLDPVYVGERRHRVARTKRVDEVGIHELLVKNLGQDKRGGKNETCSCRHRRRASFLLGCPAYASKLGRTAPHVTQTKASDALVQVRERAELIGPTHRPEKSQSKSESRVPLLEHCYGVRSESTLLLFLHTSWRSLAESEVARARMSPAGTVSPSLPCLTVSKCRECVSRAKLESSIDCVSEIGRAAERRQTARKYQGWRQTSTHYHRRPKPNRRFFATSTKERKGETKTSGSITAFITASRDEIN